MLAGKLVLIFIFILSAPIFGIRYPHEAYQDYVYEIERSFGEQISKEFGFLPSGSMNSMHEKVEKLGLRFLIFRRTTIEEARAIHLLLLERFVQAINCHEKIQPYLAIQPFSHKRVTITINFEGINGRHSDGTITYMFNVSDLATTSSRNQIVYHSHDSFTGELIEALEEPIEEAMRLNAALAIDPTVHQGNEYEEEMDALLASFIKEAGEQYQLRVWHIGGNWKEGIEDIGATIKLKQFANQEEARQLLVEVVEKLLSAVNSNEKVRSFLKVYPFPASLLKLAFWFEETNANPFPDIRLTKMILEDNVVTYVQETLFPLEAGRVLRDSEEVILPLETYQEAFQIVEKNPVPLKSSYSSIFNRMKNWLVKWIQ